MLELIKLMEIQNKLRPQLRQILTHCKAVGFISGRTALIDYGIVSLSRRINDLEELGYTVTRERKKHPATGQRYVRYSVDDLAVSAAA